MWQWGSSFHTWNGIPNRLAESLSHVINSTIRRRGCEESFVNFLKSWFCVLLPSKWTWITIPTLLDVCLLDAEGTSFKRHLPPSLIGQGQLLFLLLLLLLQFLFLWNIIFHREIWLLCWCILQDSDSSSIISMSLCVWVLNFCNKFNRLSIENRKLLKRVRRTDDEGTNGSFPSMNGLRNGKNLRRPLRELVREKTEEEDVGAE